MKKVNAYHVTRLNFIRPERYSEGSIFISEKDEVAILVNGKVKKLTTTTPNMSQYVKKSEVKDMINQALKEVK